MIKVAISSCPNDTFAFYHLIHHSQFSKQIDLTITDIDELNKMVLKKEIDFCKASFYAFAKQQNDYSLLTSGCALGSCGPLVISKTKKKLHEGSIIAIPGELTTANLLLSLYYPQIKKKKMMPFDRILDSVIHDEVDAGLIIHESRFTYQQKKLHAIIDLGEWWKKKTNNLIPLGAILANRQLPLSTVNSFNNALHDSIKKAQNPNYKYHQDKLKFIRQYAQEMEIDIIQKHIETYVTAQTLNLTTSGIQAIKKLFHLANEKKLCPKIEKALIR